MIQTSIPNIDLVTRPRHLIPGPLARLRHQQKASEILKLTYLTHVISIPCVEAVLGTSNSNSNATIRCLVNRKLLQEVVLTSSPLAPNGRVFMLTKQGLSVAQSACDREDLHDYDTRPESIRRAQLEPVMRLAFASFTNKAHQWMKLVNGLPSTVARHGDFVDEPALARQAIPQG